MSSTTSTEQANFFSAISNPIRLEVVKILRERGDAVSKDMRTIISDRLGRDISQSLLSQQMRSLREAGIVSTERRQQSIVFRLNPGKAPVFQEYLADMMDAFNSVD